MEAVRARDRERVRALLEADPAAANDRAAEDTVDYKRLDEWLDGAAVTPLFVAVQRGDAAIVGLLLDAGADMEATSRGFKGSTCTALGEAVRLGDAALVRLLLDRGASVRSPEPWGWCDPLAGAARSEDPKILAWVLDAGADPNTTYQSSSGQWYPYTPLKEAANWDQVDNIKVLLERGADPNLRVPGDDDTPLHYVMLLGATCAEMADAVRLLIRYGAEVNAVGHDGATPLHRFALGDRCREPNEVLDLLLDSGARLDAVDEDGDTPLELARERRHDWMVEALRTRGAHE
jgi:ankyrin repeat protein